MSDKIDFVVPWVDGNDPDWQKEKNKYTANQTGDSRDIRFRDFGLLRYWFRAIEENAPWVNKIFFITWGHIPEWLNTNHEKIVVVNHKDYIPAEYLPTFSSHVIELNMHRIPELGERFVYFNDDVYILDAVKSDDFFVDGMPCDCFVENPIAPVFGGFSSILNETVSVINKNFNKSEIKKHGRMKYLNPVYGRLNLRTIGMSQYANIMGFYDQHITIPHLKSTFFEVWDKEFDELNRTCLNKFRGKNDVNQYLFRYWNLCTGRFTPRYPLGRNIKMSEDIDSIVDIIRNSKYKIVTINDVAGIDDMDERQEKISRALNEKYSRKCSYELQ